MKTKLFTLLLVIMLVQLLPAQEVEKPTSWKAYLLSEMQGMVEGGKKLGGEVIDQLKVQVPDLVNQLLWWEGIKSLLGFLVGVAFFIVGIIAYRIMNNKICSQDLNEDWLFFKWLWTIVGVGAGIAVSFANLTWLKIIVAPKLFLFQYFADYIK